MCFLFVCFVYTHYSIGQYGLLHHLVCHPRVLKWVFRWKFGFKLWFLFDHDFWPLNLMLPYPMLKDGYDWSLLVYLSTTCSVLIYSWAAVIVRCIDYANGDSNSCCFPFRIIRKRRIDLISCAVIRYDLFECVHHDHSILPIQSVRMYWDSVSVLRQIFKLTWILWIRRITRLIISGQRWRRAAAAFVRRWRIAHWRHTLQVLK